MSEFNAGQVFNADGTVEAWSVGRASTCLGLSSDSDLTVVPSLVEIERIFVRFLSSADGRGFSLAQYLRLGRKFSGELIAGGALMPDQLSLCFQCGYDSVLVTEDRLREYGKHAWQNAHTPLISLSYAKTRSPMAESIWDRRAMDCIDRVATDHPQRV